MIRGGRNKGKRFYKFTIKRTGLTLCPRVKIGVPRVSEQLSCVVAQRLMYLHDTAN